MRISIGASGDAKINRFGISRGKVDGDTRQSMLWTAGVGERVHAAAAVVPCRTVCITQAGLLGKYRTVPNTERYGCLRKALGETCPTPSFLAPTHYLQLWRYRE